ncbi:MAG: hypothetical protein DI537_23820 [Stutzerimonas stutzeri]|nr:MAG: hypothetical protein DI537_23820 [Stutzerimonas stutzeri]
MGAEQAPKRGRPTDYTDDLVAEFCRRIASGRSVASICEDEDMPSHNTIYRWQAGNREFSERLAHARAERTEAYSGQIAALSTRALTEKDLDPARVRVAIDALDKAARLMQPRKVELTGAGGGPIKTQDLSRLSDEQLSALNAILGTVADVGGGEGGDPAPGDREGA